MKKSVYTYVVVGSNFNIDLEVLLDINRNLTKIDEQNIAIYATNLAESLHQESINIDPKSKKDAIQEREGIIRCFGNKTIFVEEIPNEYCPRYCCKHLPWFIVTTSKGRIKIGWRKSVISIDWSDSIIKEDTYDLFPNENVTKLGKLIHAWGYDKAKEYIDKLLS